MRKLILLTVGFLVVVAAGTSCVDPLNVAVVGKLNVVIVDGTITNLAEQQTILLNRSKSDPLTGRPGSLPITGATVAVIVDSTQVIQAHETVDGTYVLPSDFSGQVGHTYQLRFTLSDGSPYESTKQIMPAAPPIASVRAQFNPTSLLASELGGYTAAHDLYITTQDPASETNFYRWDWKLWEKQEWCRTCVQGQYSINNVLVLTSANGFKYFQTGDALFEDCFYPPQSLPGQPGTFPYFVYDYSCRTACWAILYSHQLNVFADSFVNGSLITNYKAARVPFYQYTPCLVEVRQSALTAPAYRFYKQFQDQTQNNGGVADSPPTASVGNVQNMAKPQEKVVGFFTASAVSTTRYWLDRKDFQGEPPGLFRALNGREPIREPSFPMSPIIYIVNTTSQLPPYTAVCSPNESRTPFKPVGWRE